VKREVVLVQVRVAPEVADKLRQAARENGRSMNGHLALLLTEHVLKEPPSRAELARRLEALESRVARYLG
jgi:hypothetical protein